MLQAASAPAVASKSVDWYKASPVFARGAGLKECERLENIPLSLWGNSRKVTVDERPSADGTHLNIQGTYENGETETYTIYVSAERCNADATYAENSNADILEKVAPQDHKITTPSKKQWYSHDINHANCISSPSPADKIRETQSWGQTAKTNDLPSGAVEVEVEIGNGKSQVWTFYRSPESCETSLPRVQKIDSKYE